MLTFKRKAFHKKNGAIESQTLFRKIFRKCLVSVCSHLSLEEFTNVFRITNFMILKKILVLPATTVDDRFQVETSSFVSACDFFLSVLNSIYFSETINLKQFVLDWFLKNTCECLKNEQKTSTESNVELALILKSVVDMIIYFIEIDFDPLLLLAFQILERMETIEKSTTTTTSTMNNNEGGVVVSDDEKDFLSNILHISIKSLLYYAQMEVKEEIVWVTQIRVLYSKLDELLTLVDQK